MHLALRLTEAADSEAAKGSWERSVPCQAVDKLGGSRICSAFSSLQPAGSVCTAGSLA